MAKKDFSSAALTLMGCGLTHDTISREVGVSRVSVGRWLAGEFRAPDELFDIIARHCGADVAALVRQQVDAARAERLAVAS